MGWGWTLIFRPPQQFVKKKTKLPQQPVDILCLAQWIANGLYIGSF